MQKSVDPKAAVEAAVKHCYSTWGTSYYTDYYGPSAPYPPVHLDMVKRLIAELAPQRLLDAGCGPASMLRHLTAPGRALYGFDLTPEMVAEAKRVMAGQGDSPVRIWEGSALDRHCYAAPGEAAEAYDAVLCCGVLPHIPEEADVVCIENMASVLRPGGYAIVEARNELFSLFTLNRYSHQLFLDRLIPVDALRHDAGGEREGLERALQQVGDMFRNDLPPIRKGKEDEPGYDEVLSRVHNPLVLREQFQAAGFDQVRLLFYHFHCLPPMVAEHAPELFRRASIGMEADPENWRGLFMASAFFVMARKA